MGRMANDKTVMTVLDWLNRMKQIPSVEDYANPFRDITLVLPDPDEDTFLQVTTGLRREVCLEVFRPQARTLDATTRVAMTYEDAMTATNPRFPLPSFSGDRRHLVSYCTNVRRAKHIHAKGPPHTLFK
ncbi:uncharacterized protein BYT42DRAFT_547977 [Radiomyces spectabilis]|uniref:uncharacterized protein n=1 Tax=Radiomyces spectabilis TaxID=64574 RepID=UPI002220BF62|nr:uncharacterized protein BYT42DRAFT_547977 [Radiomyces spectabilis]KAI8372957.1 hypothetical protein BYT42DRAFT_547977 [Radiomyces spectabilis]